jgi:hypothetical protein
MDKDIKLIYDKLKELNRNILCKTSTGTVTDACCPATNTLLGEIKTALDNLDISIDNLVLNTDTLEINTDGLETLLTTLNTITQIENDENQVLLTDIKDNLQAIIDKLNQPCGTDSINVNVCNEAAIDTFQVKDCTGLDVGTPQEVKKTVVLNNISTKICNVEELANAINVGTPSLVTYNSEEELIIPQNSTYNIPANSIHAYSVNVSGSGITSTISINGSTPVSITSGYTKQIEFTTMNTFSINIFCGINSIIRIGKQF